MITLRIVTGLLLAMSPLAHAFAADPILPQDEEAVVESSAAFRDKYPDKIAKNIQPYPYRAEQISGSKVWIVTLATADTRPISRTWWRYCQETDRKECGGKKVQEISSEEAAKFVSVEKLR